jgi:hypothetical protein
LPAQQFHGGKDSILAGGAATHPVR